MKTRTVINRILHRFITNENGLALPVVLILLALVGLTIAPLMTYMSGGLNTTQIHEEKTIEQYSSDSAIDHAIWRLLYDSQFIGSMTVENPSVQYSVNINGTDVPITVTRLAGMGGDTFTLNVNHTVPAGHLLEFAVTVLEGGFCHFAYDTATYNSGVIIPTTSGTKTYYLHNNPTPPTADTDAQEDLPLDESQPVATILYNYDQWDNDPGRRIKKSNIDEMQELLGLGPGHLDLYQNWQTAVFSSDTRLSGTAVISLWVDLTGQSYGTDGSFKVFLMDYDPGFNTYTEIASADYKVKKEWVTGGWTPTAAEGKYRILASAGDTQIEATVALGFDYLRMLSFIYR